MTAVSPSVATGELDGARRVADHIGIAHEIVRTDELARPGYRANGPDRCYFCKSELYDVLAQLAKDRGYNALLSGANQDDQGDWRPGLKAAAEHGVVHPLQDDVEGRGAATRPRTEPAQRREARLTVPGEPHPLRHRGRPARRWRRIDEAERNVKALGFPVLRVRHHGIMGRLEVAQEDLERALDDEAEIIEAIKAAGYRHAVIDSRALPLRPPQRGASASRSIAVSEAAKRARASGVIGSMPDSRARNPASEK